MTTDPRAIARDDWARSRDRSVAVAQAWRGSPDHIALADAFDDLALSSVAIARDRAVALLGDAQFGERLLAPLLAELAGDPLFEPPLRASRERARTGAVLFDAPAARVTASVLSARQLAERPSRSVIVPGHVMVTRYVRSGGARIRRWRIDGDRIDEIAPLFPQDGDVAIHDGRTEAQAVVDAKGDVVTICAILRAGAAPVMREFAVTGGTLLRTASTDESASRTALLLTLLRVSGRADAGAVFDAATRDPAPHARWSAMREWLALDAAGALPRLRAMADEDTDAEVRTIAETTYKAITARIASRTGTPCPA